MILSKEILLTASKEKPKKGDAEAILQAVSHLYLNEKNLSDVEALKFCPRVQVLYLYQNALPDLDGVRVLLNLTHLYAQHNQISSLEPLAALVHLKKVVLDYNCISVVEHLKRLVKLEEARHTCVAGWFLTLRGSVIDRTSDTARR
jgi:Leucine-rich repeat (LRR) protein